MRMKLISEVKPGFAFHYRDNEERVFVKYDKVTAVNPEGRLTRVSPSTLVVPHEGQFKKEKQDE